MVISLRKILFWSIVILFVTLTATTKITVGAELPTFWVTWNALSYTAPHFEGKALPSIGTPINVAFELVSNGKVVTLGSQEVRWYLGETMVKKGQGVKEYSFRSGISSGAYLVRIELPGFKGGASLIKSIQIPATRPELVLDAPYNRSAITGSELNLQALAYYFNASRSSDLLWNWKVNNETPRGEAQVPDKITITIPEGAPTGSQILTNIEVVNSKNQSERAEAMALFTTH